MLLSQFHQLIDSMPVAYQAFESKRSTWKKHIDSDSRAGNALRSLFGNQDKVVISRHDLTTYAKAQDLTIFVIATILWGYPAGMRGNHFANIIANLDPLLELLTKGRDDGVHHWSAHFQQTKPITGLGLSTYTKFLHFMGVKVHGQTALILDDRILKVARRKVFGELSPLQSIGDYNKEKKFPEYLDCIHKIALKTNLAADKIEFFLFEFGLCLKEPNSQRQWQT